MSRTRQASRRGSYLGQTIRGYRGYGSSKKARLTDQVFSEEVLSRLSDTMATVSRMKRLTSADVDPGAVESLDAIIDQIDNLADEITDMVPVDATLPDSLEGPRAKEIVGLDSSILEKVGHINQALSVMDLEGGVGISCEELDSVCELLDDLADCLRRRAALIAGQPD